jgi:DNA-binding CsgD family transcriptional regulator
LDEKLNIETMTPGVERWVADLPDGNWDTGTLPTAIQSVAGSALRSSDGPADGSQVAMARVMGRSGAWIVVHGAAMVAPGSRRVAVIVEPAHPAKISTLMMTVYGLTDREKELTRLVLQGNSTAEIAASLFISANTVQQHLKAIFDKTGVRSRRDLVGKVFFAHYEPRFRDNEHRVVAKKPVRGGPAGP